MRTALDVSDEEFNDYEKRFVSLIRKHGWYRTSVLGDESNRSFSYTTGLWVNVGHPEIIIFSIDPDPAHGILSSVHEDAARGTRYPIAQPFDGLLADFPAVFLPVEKRLFADYVLSSRWFYGGDDFECLQLVWPDTSGRFPWQVGANDRFADSQPDLSGGNWAGLGDTA